MTLVEQFKDFRNSIDWDGDSDLAAGDALEANLAAADRDSVIVAAARELRGVLDATFMGKAWFLDTGPVGFREAAAAFIAATDPAPVADTAGGGE